MKMIHSTSHLVDGVQFGANCKDCHEVRKKASEDLFKVLERITDGCYVLSKHWIVEYCNKEAETMLGRKREEVLGKNLWELFPEAVHLDFYQQFHKALQTQEPVYFEGYYPPIDIWVDISVYPSEDGLSIFFRNITDRKKLEQEQAVYKTRLKKQNTLLNEILDRIAEAFFAVDANGIITYWNRQAEKLVGVSKEVLIGKHLLDCFPQAVGTTVELNFKKAIEEQTPVFFTAPSIVRSALLQWAVYPSENGLTVFYQDITEKKKAEEELFKLSLIAQRNQDAVLMFDLDKSVLWANEAFTKISGYTLEEVKGRRLGDFIWGPETNMEAIKRMNESWEKFELFEYENIYYTKQKKKVYCEASLQPLFNPSGEPIQFFVVLRDITEKKLLQKRITTAAIKAQERERAHVSQELHDNVNQVLTTVKLYNELCRDGVGDARVFLERSIKLLQESIDEIRNLSKRLSVPAVNRAHLKDSVKELVDRVAATNRVAISLDITEILVLDISEELHLAVYRILQEHLTNVLKYAEAKSVQVEFLQYKDSFIMKVTDDGKGFDTTLKRKGIGITNMITRAEGVNGSLRLDSEPCKGCVLTGRFPLEGKI